MTALTLQISEIQRHHIHHIRDIRESFCALLLVGIAVGKALTLSQRSLRKSSHIHAIGCLLRLIFPHVLVCDIFVSGLTRQVHVLQPDRINPIDRLRKSDCAYNAVCDGLISWFSAPRDVSGNPITSIASGAFASLSQLTFLYVSGP